MSKAATSELRQRVGDLLDRVMVRRENGYAVQQELRGIADEQGDGDPEIATLLARAQGLVGMVNSSAPDSPMLDRAYQELAAFKQELRAASAP